MFKASLILLSTVIFVTIFIPVDLANKVEKDGMPSIVYKKQDKLNIAIDNTPMPEVANIDYVAPPAKPAPVIAYTSGAKMFIYMHESGNNPAAINQSSGACGLGQSLPCSKMGCSLSDYACQDAWFTKYAITRYGSWDAAAAFWRSHLWW